MNLASIVEHHGRFSAAKPAVEFDGQVTSYSDLDRSVRSAAAVLRRKGVKAGHRVGLMMTESPRHVVAFLAVARLGATVLPMDWRWTSTEFSRVVESFAPFLVVTDRDRPQVGFEMFVGADELESAQPDDSPAASLRDAPLVYSLSSGTTGQPKAMIVTHEMMYARFVNIVTEFPLLREDRFLALLPLAYAAGQLFMMTTLCLGATMIQVSPLVAASELVDLVNARRVSAVHIPPNVTRSLLALPPIEGRRLMPDLRLYVSGTAGLTAEERSLVRKRIATRTLALYGCAGGGPLALLHDETDAIAPASVGIPVPTAEIGIVDESGRETAAGSAGWVRVRGSCVVKETIGSAPGGDEGVRDGWYYPGDIGSFDAQGYLQILGRSAEVIKRAGKTIYGQEVEGVLLSHEAVREVAVVGVPGGEIGEDIVAFVVPKHDRIGSRELMHHCRRHLAPFKIPQRIVIAESLPRNPSGKVLKGRLRASS